MVVVQVSSLQVKGMIQNRNQVYAYTKSISWEASRSQVPKAKREIQQLAKSNAQAKFKSWEYKSNTWVAKPILYSKPAEASSWLESLGHHGQ